jgi:hypothetical protein
VSSFKNIFNFTKNNCNDFFEQFTAKFLAYFQYAYVRVLFQLRTFSVCFRLWLAIVYVLDYNQWGGRWRCGTLTRLQLNSWKIRYCPHFVYYFSRGWPTLLVYDSIDNTRLENLLLIISNLTQSENTCWLSGKNYCSEEILLLVNNFSCDKQFLLLLIIRKIYF